MQQQPEAVQARKDYDKARVHTHIRMRRLFAKEWQEIFEEERRKIIMDRQWQEAVDTFATWADANGIVTGSPDTAET